MTSRMALRVAIVTLWLSVALSVAVSFSLESDLPVLLQEYLLWDLEREWTRFEFALILVETVVVVVSLVGSVGLFMLRIWGRNLFVLSVLALTVLTPFTGPTVQHGIQSVFSDIESLCDGLVLAIVFFTDAIKTVPSDA